MEEKNNFRQIGFNHCYLDYKIEGFSNIALGIITRSIGADLKIAYFNQKKYSFILVDFFYKFYLKNLNFYSYNSLLINQIKNYDIIIFDNFSLKDIKEDEIKEIIKNKNKNTELIFVINNQNDYKILKKNFDLITKFNYKYNKKNKNQIKCIYGNGKGKSTYSFGLIIKELINKNLVKLIYFDKGGNFYSEKKFFDKLRYINRKFQYFSYGNQRFDNNKFRFDNNDDDYLEAEYALKEIKRSYDEHIIFADELNTIINTKLLSEDKVIKTLQEIKNKLIITGRCNSEKLIKICNETIEVEEIKYYKAQEKENILKKGIDI